MRGPGTERINHMVMEHFHILHPSCECATALISEIHAAHILHLLSESQDESF